MNRTLFAVILALASLGIANQSSADNNHKRWVDLGYNTTVVHRPSGTGGAADFKWSRVLNPPSYSEEEFLFLAWYFDVPPQEIGLLLPAIQKVRN